MNGNLVIGCVTMAVCVGIQCLVVSIMLRVLDSIEQRGWIRATVPGASTILTVIMLMMVGGNFVQMAIWAVVFMNLGEFTDFATAFYHSTVNFATLGYGDLVMSEKRRLLGALEAVNGVLMIGLSTSVLFAILNVLMQRAWSELGSKVKTRPGGRGGR